LNLEPFRFGVLCHPRRACHRSAERQRAFEYFRFYGHFSSSISRAIWSFRGCRSESVGVLCLGQRSITLRERDDRIRSLAAVCPQSTSFFVKSRRLSFRGAWALTGCHHARIQGRLYRRMEMDQGKRWSAYNSCLLGPGWRNSLSGRPHPWRSRRLRLA
jgi:hypothetical protein